MRGLRNTRQTVAKGAAVLSSCVPARCSVVAKIPPHERDEMRELYEGGLPIQRIANRYHVARGTIRNYAKAGGWAKPEIQWKIAMEL